jgi:hypothetical protein
LEYPSKAKAAIVAATRLRVTDLSRRVREDQLFYERFGVGLCPSGKFSVTPSLKARPAPRLLEKWHRLYSGQKSAALQSHYYAWIIQSMWRAYVVRKGGEKPSGMKGFLRINVSDLQNAEIKGLNSIADELLEKNLMSLFVQS